MAVDWTGFAYPKVPPGRDSHYRLWISQQPCAICAGYTHGGNHPHHEAEAGGRGVAIKAPDNDLMPLCHVCHNLRHQTGYETFWNGKDPGQIKENFRLRYAWRENAEEGDFSWQ